MRRRKYIEIGYSSRVYGSMSDQVVFIVLKIRRVWRSNPDIRIANIIPDFYFYAAPFQGSAESCKPVIAEELMNQIWGAIRNAFANLNAARHDHARLGPRGWYGDK